MIRLFNSYIRVLYLSKILFGFKVQAQLSQIYIYISKFLLHPKTPQDNEYIIEYLT